MNVSVVVRKILGIAALGCSLNSAFAQSASDVQNQEPVLLEEVVVTAQFREEGLQKTPVAITVVNAEQIAARSMTRITDLSAFAPNVLATPAAAAYGPAAQFYIRGVGQNDSTFAFEPGVGIYVDDVYNGILLGSTFDLLDLDRVEVLRGPQGTLSGKNSLGGSVKLFSRKPDGDGGGFVEATYGDFNRTDIRASGNFTLVPETLFARLSGVSKHRDGYLRRLDYACVNPGSGVPPQMAVGTSCEIGTEGGQDVQAMRLAVRWIATETIEDNLIADVTQDRSEIAATKTLVLNNPLVPNSAQFLTPSDSYTSYSTYGNLGFTDPANFAAAPGAGTHTPFSLPTNAPVDAYGVSNKIEWKLADALSITSITGLRHYQGQYSIDYDTTPYTIQLLSNVFSHRQFTQELRLNGTSLSLLDWTVGAYYYDAKSRSGGLRLISPSLATENIFNSNDTIPSSSKSGFVHAVFHANSQLSLIAGARYTKEDKDYNFGRQNPYAPGPAYTAAGAIDNTTGTYAGNRTDYRGGIEYQWAPTFMTYAQYSTGFKGGGVNPRPFVAEQEVPFKPETVRAAELGAKSDLFGHHLRVNVAAFYNKYQDIIFTNNAPTPNSAANATPVNAGDADVTGAELELNARVFDGLSVDASASYLNFNLKSIAAGITTVTTSTQQIFAPKRKASLGVQYRLPLGTLGTLTPRVDGQYQSSFFTGIDNNVDGQVQSYTIANARLLWESMSGDWQGALALTNATDKFYYLNKFRQGPPFNFVIGQPGAPREWSVSIKRTF